MLPPVLTITPEMLRLIAELDEFKGQWRMIRSLSPGKLTSLRKVATIESVGSSTRIEGSKLTDRQVEDLLGRLHISDFSTRDEQEVAGYAHVPYSSLESVIEATKEGYYRALRRTQSTLGSGHPDWEAWLLFFLRSLVRQKDVLATKIDLDDTRTDDLHPLAKKILALLPDHEILTLGQVVTLTGGRPSTVKLRLRELVEKGYLVPKGRGRGAHYVRGLPNVRGSCYLSKHHPSHE
jgi:Fic family protein